MPEGFSSTALRLGLALAVIGVGSCSDSSGGGSGENQCFGGECKLNASDAAIGDIYGLSVDVSGDQLVVGSSQDDDNGESSGSVYVYRLDGDEWGNEKKVLASDGVAFDRFGEAVAIDGDVMVVGARSADSTGAAEAGVAYVFRLVGSEWVEEAKLEAMDGASGDSFGWVVDVDGDVIVVGAHTANGPSGCNVVDGSGCSIGAAYMFRRVAMTWVAEDKLVASDAMGGDRFGGSVSVSGDAVVVGAAGVVLVDPTDPLKTLSNAGAAYVFRFNPPNWVEEQKIIALRAPNSAPGCNEPQVPQLDTELNANFGVSVSIDGDVIAVGADGVELRTEQVSGCFRNRVLNNIGAIYVYNFNDPVWDFEQKLQVPDGKANVALGSSVSIDGDRIAGGSRGDDTNGQKAGSAYIFAFDNMEWASGEKFLANDGRAFDFFGTSLRLNGDALVVGAYGTDDVGPLTGAVYAYEL